MRRIFSFAYWPSICLLWKNVYLGFLPIFWLNCLLLTFRSCLYILDIKPGHLCHLKIFSVVSYLFVLFIVSLLCQSLYVCCCLVVSDSYVAPCSLPRSSVHGISQARILEWDVISFSRESSHPKDWTHISHPFVYFCFYFNFALGYWPKKTLVWSMLERCFTYVLF